MFQVQKLFEKEYSQCYKNFRELIVRFIYSKILCFETAQDLAQEVFMKIYEKKLFLDPWSSETRNYLYTIARNQIRDYYKKKYRENLKLMEYRAKEAFIGSSLYKGLENAYLQGKIISTLHDTIDDYKDKKGDIFVTRVFGGTTQKSVSRDYKMSAYHVKKIELEVAEKILENILNIDPEFFS